MTQLPHAFKRIRLELARSKEFPNGSANHGYELVAPLDADAHIDAALWQKYRENCRVSRFWGDGEEIGYLLHKPGDQNTRAGSSTTTRQGNMKTNTGIGLEHIPFVLAITFQSRTKLVRSIHFGWFQWPPSCDLVGNSAVLQPGARLPVGGPEGIARAGRSRHVCAPYARARRSRAQRATGSASPTP